ncbi:ribonuclease catalytic domain-containing protein [Demequina sp.]|uniref:ribonuclease catalytic domain-containing protein n=1 Tax=Demequina sp. TaxID=2050685 RepID=UPI003A88CB1A
MRIRRNAGAAHHEVAPYIDHALTSSGAVIVAPDAALREALESATESDPGHIPDARGDATDVPFVTVDPPGSRDLDQAVHVERHARGWRVRYAIADVGAHVTPGSALDDLAHARGVTLYCPDRRIGLHPPEMSEAHASLLEGQRTKAVLWTLDIDPNGAVALVGLERVWVRSRRQLTYAEVHAGADELTSELRTLFAEVGDARRLGVSRAGGVTLPKPEQEVDSRKERFYLTLRAALPCEDDNAQVSLATGTVAAQAMVGAGAGVLRTMPPASQEALDALRREALALGIVWPAGADYAEILRAVDPQSPSGLAFLTAATRLFRGARWAAFDVAAGVPVPSPATHGALAAPYAHVTAPLRRLVDRYATEAALSAFTGRALQDWARAGLERAAQDTARGAALAGDVERRCVDALESVVLRGWKGHVFEAVGIDRTTVQLREPPVVGPCETPVPVGEAVAVVVAEAQPPQGPRFASVSST